MVGKRASLSLLELNTNGVFPSGPSTGELIYVLEGSVEISGAAGKDVLGQGDGAFIPAGVRHSFRRQGGATAKLLIIETPPGGEVAKPSDAGWAISRGAAAQTYAFAGGNASAKMIIDAPPGSPGFLGILSSVAPFFIAPHNHGAEAEIIFVLTGTGSLIADGKETPFAPGTAVAIGPGIQHAVRVNPGAPFSAVQFYTPSGPEQRFKPAPLP